MSAAKQYVIDPDSPTKRASVDGLKVRLDVPVKLNKDQIDRLSEAGVKLAEATDAQIKAADEAEKDTADAENNNTGETS